MVDPSPPTQGPQGPPGLQGHLPGAQFPPDSQGYPQISGGDAPEQLVQTMDRRQPPQAFVVPPAAQTRFTPVLPPNLPTMLSMHQKAPNVPGMSMSPMPRQYLQGPGLLQQSTFGQEPVRDLQAARFLEHYSRTQFPQALPQLNTIAQQHHQLGFLPPPNPQFNPKLTLPPNRQVNPPLIFGQRLPSSGPYLSRYYGPPRQAQSAIQQGQPNRLQNKRNAPPVPLVTFAQQVFHDMNTQSPEEFVHGIKRARATDPVTTIFRYPQQQTSTPNPNLNHPILHHPRPRSGSFQSAPRSGGFPPSPTAMVGHRSQRSSKGSNLGMANSSAKDSTMGMGDSSTNISTMDRGDQRGVLQRNVGSDDSGYHTREQSSSVPPARGTTANAPTASLDDQIQSASSDGDEDQIDGSLVPHEQERFDDDAAGWGNTNNADLDAILGDVLEGVDTAAKDLIFPEGSGDDWTAEDVNKSVPFMKATIFLKHHECDTRASVGGEIPGPRLIVISHGNRTMTWEAYAAQYKQDLDQDVNRAQLFPDEIPLNVDKFFNLYPNTGRYFMGNFHKDTAAIDHIPGAGQLSQYLPRSIDTELWYNQIINLQDNVDLWLPMPLLHIMSIFIDTPYGLANAYPLEVQKSTLPGRSCEFTEAEADTLMCYTMERYRFGLDKRQQHKWELYQTLFNFKYKWAPTLQRMRVLDLMLQIDFIYFLQGMVGPPLHPWTKYYRNNLSVTHGNPLCPLNDGP